MDKWADAIFLFIYNFHSAYQNYFQICQTKTLKLIIFDNIRYIKK